MIIYLIKGIIVGICASVPLGPVGLICIQKTLNKGKFSGWVSGMGAAVSDLLYASVALLGISLIKDFMDKNDDWVLFIGGLLVAAYGVKFFLTNPVKQIHRPEQNTSSKKYWQDFFTTMIMALSNPGSLFILLALFAFMHIAISSGESTTHIHLILWGVFFGATLWWYTLSTIINKFRNKFRIKELLWVNRLFGIITFIFGIISTVAGIIKLLKI